MAKVAVALRLRPETLARVDAYAKARGSSRQVVLEMAVDSFLEDTERGVPDLPEPESPAVREARAKVEAVQRPVDPGPAFADPNGSRQQQLNAMALRSRAKR